MSESNASNGRRGRDPGSVYQPADESSASVFGEPTPPRAPSPPTHGAGSHDGGAYPPSGAYPPPAPQPGYSGGAPGSSAYGPPATQVYGQPPVQSGPGQAYAPAPHRAPGQPGLDPPYGQDPRQSGRPGPDRRRRQGTPRPDRGGQGGSPRERGGGLPVGFGALVGIGGAVCFVAALVVSPWFTADGREVTLSDMRSAFTVAETDPDALLPGTTDGTAPDPSDGVPTPDQVGEIVEQQARAAAAEAAADAIDSGKSRYLELYAGTLWMVLAAGVALAAVFSTVLSPRSFALSMVLGFRRLSGAVTVLAGLAHGAALWIVFTGGGAPSPAPRVWVGVAGLGAVLLGCIIGPKR